MAGSCFPTRSMARAFAAASTTCFRPTGDGPIRMRGTDMSEPEALDLSGCETLLEGASEFLRMWYRPGGPVTCFIDPVPIGADPVALGIALVDCVRHGAKAYAHALSISEEEALARIW